ncbi:molybdopterin converting factor subunit 1 [Vibrio ulleungensis]|uniref:Molybdopterin synthase sulfur carrier subunit n=1 Tax=Vibrio ulleungensis TaxID=2807619 RepID=A0ABS2HGR3_9VIBR|nr:molybdopterin converting factor subunit 1 [Vibrio ulleungensis]MBM7036725.1 molybdopterin converting factor subunit 1 [Vibrio ulleungensis]
MINVLYFAKTREIIGKMSDSVSLELLDSATAESVRTHLLTKSKAHERALGTENLLVAVNQTMVPMSTEIVQGDEVAFFPPVTGG